MACLVPVWCLSGTCLLIFSRFPFFSLLYCRRCVCEAGTAVTSDDHGGSCSDDSKSTVPPYSDATRSSSSINKVGLARESGRGESGRGASLQLRMGQHATHPSPRPAPSPRGEARRQPARRFGQLQRKAEHQQGQRREVSQVSREAQKVKLPRRPSAPGGPFAAHGRRLQSPLPLTASPPDPTWP